MAAMVHELVCIVSFKGEPNHRIGFGTASMVLGPGGCITSSRGVRSAVRSDPLGSIGGVTGPLLARARASFIGAATLGLVTVGGIRRLRRDAAAALGETSPQEGSSPLSEGRPGEVVAGMRVRRHSRITVCRES